MYQSLKIVLIGTIVASAIGCAPKDKNVQPNKGASSRQANLEKSAVKGADYLLYIASRISEIKDLAELSMRKELVAKSEISAGACGQLVINRVDANHQMLRTTTVGCDVNNGAIESLNLRADGEDTIDIWRDAAGTVLRVEERSAAPLVVSGKIGKGDFRNSIVQLHESRQISIDEISAASTGNSINYRATLSVRWDWRQEIMAPTFKGYETGQQNLMIKAVVRAEAGRVQSMVIEDMRLSAYAPREISRSKRARADTPNVNYHKIDLLARAVESKEKSPIEITFDTNCSRPLGSLEIVDFDTTVSDDKIKSKVEPAVHFTDKGIEIPASETIAPWGKCEEPSATNQLRPEVPYSILFFK